LSRASAIASSTARATTRLPSPLSPSTIAAAFARRITVISGRVLSPPALMRRMYCGRRKTPCPSAPLMSEAAINSAAFAASASGMPAAR
jgi:hypothetical protein